MFDKKTLIVVGAGASKEANIPTGDALKDSIANILDIKFEHGVHQISGDRLVYSALQEAIKRTNAAASDIDSYQRVAWRIRDAMPQAISIDNFIDAHQGDKKLELCGKLAIVQSILEAERNSFLFFEKEKSNSTLHYDSLKETWFNRFMKLLTENCRADQLEKRLSAIAFIIFNYDRCVEHFLYHSLQTYYGIEPDHAANLVRGIEIYHPYGTVGALPWCRGTHAVDFGAEVNTFQLLDLAGQIKTFTEGTDPQSSDVTEIRKSFVASRIVLFLGFAFHRLNLELIKPQGAAHSNPDQVRYFGTAMRISNNDCNLIIAELQNLAGVQGNNVSLRNDLSCCELFQEYWRSLAFG